MAASGFTPIVPYYSTVTGHTPTTMITGELAVNITDGKIFVGTGTNTFSTYSLINPAAVAFTGGTINGTSIGATTPSTGAFTTLSATSTVSGAGFTALFASPPAIGGTTAAAGTFTTCTATSFNSTSTKRMKKDVKKLAPQFVEQAISQLRPVSFTWKRGSPMAGKPDFGFIAEEVMELLPGIVNLDAQDRVVGMDYSRLTTILVAEVQRLRARLTALEAARDR